MTAQMTKEEHWLYELTTRNLREQEARPMLRVPFGWANYAATSIFNEIPESVLQIDIATKMCDRIRMSAVQDFNRRELQ